MSRFGAAVSACVLVGLLTVASPAVVAGDSGAPGCPAGLSCVTFDPPAARPRTTVTITSVDQRPIGVFGDCPRFDWSISLDILDGPQVGYEIPRAFGTQSRVTFTVPPPLLPGEYEVFANCIDTIGEGQGLHPTFTVLGLSETSTIDKGIDEANPGVWALGILAAMAVVLTGLAWARRWAT